ncbi:MAG: DUF1638 domain-containing protein [Oscillospiraceae bacterium]|nr:DUF1638 domain-containing protein [Oscillospiraceae bacterium]MDD4414832.1 DUF1638 domain-containing protein [Oscillospiraceae bacterium]
MRIHIIACRVFTRELSYYASRSPHVIDITWLPQGLHDTPEKLRRMLKDAIDDIYIQKEKQMLKHLPDYIVLGYGLCSNGVVGLESRDIPLVIPRTDDCIAVFLGSQKRYLDLFEKYNGTYWLNNGWIETAFIPSKEMFERRYNEYKELYGEENAEFLLEQDKLWTKNYNTCGYIDSSVYTCPDYPLLAEKIAKDRGWKYCRFDGDCRLIKAITQGTWTDEEFLICPKGHRIEAAYDESKISAVPI